MLHRRDPAHLIAVVLASYALLGGALSLAGWITGSARLIDWWNTGVTIKANTTLCLMLLSAALLLQLLVPTSQRIALILASLAGLVGFAVLFQHLTSIELGIDTLLFDEPAGSPATASPGRMGPPASISFCLLAGGFWLAQRRQRSALAIGLPLLVLVVTSLSMIGYAYDAAPMYMAPRVTGIAVQSATMLAALSLAMLFAQPQRQPLRTLLEDSTLGELARRVFPLAIGVPILLGWVRVAGERAGWFDVAFGTALSTSVEIVIMVWVLWWALQIARARDLQRQAAEAARFDGERRLRRVLDASPLPYMVLAPVRDAADTIVDFRWTYVNGAAAQVFGRDASQLVDARLSAVFPGTWTEPGLFEHFLAAAHRHEIRDFEVRSLAGVHGWFQVIVYSLDAEIGVWFSDVAERKRQETELRDADRRKDEFVATLAHELRNPLAPIRMAASLARKPNVSEAQRQWCNDVVERQVQHMSLLLDDLLDVSRITRGVLELRPAPVSLQGLVQAALETSHPLIQSRGQQLQLDVDPDAVVEVDPLRLAQVVSNLLNNAAKYTPAGGTIRLTAEVTGEDLQISVTDTGVGIAREHLESIFNMFAQVRAAQGHAEGGLGIGLALTRGLVELHGGRLVARSDGIGHGSTFTLRIPRVGRSGAQSTREARTGAAGNRSGSGAS